LWIYSRADRNTRPYGDVKSGYAVTMAVFSPDGRWFAYVSNDNGSHGVRVYVQPFPSTGTRYEIGSGIDPVWSRDGQELINSATPTQFVAYTITTHPSFAFAKPVQLPRPFYDPGPTTERPFDTLPSGKLVALMPADTSDSAIAHPDIRVVLDWLDELKLRVK
jgi:hypothetical protein